MGLARQGCLRFCLAVAGLGALGTWAAPAAGEPLLRDAFNGADGVITNHFAFWNDGLLGFDDPNWEMESGCALRRDNALWTGIPTANIPNLACTNGSGSQIFRLWTKREDFTDVSVRMRLRNVGYSRGSNRYPAVKWDGVKLWLRRQGRSGSVGLYTAEVNRREGNVMIQKKCAGSETYRILGQTPLGGLPARIGEWERVGATIRNIPGGVRITIRRARRTVLVGIDRGRGCRPIRSAGRVGIRGDNTQFYADNFTVSAL